MMFAAVLKDEGAIRNGTPGLTLPPNQASGLMLIG